MNIGVLIGILMILGFIVVYMVGGPEDLTTLAVIPFLVFVILFMWAGFSYVQPLRTYKTIDAKIYKIENSQYIKYRPYEDSEEKLININKELGMSIPDGSLIKVSIPEEYYKGIYWPEFPTYSIINKLESEPEAQN